MLVMPVCPWADYCYGVLEGTGVLVRHGVFVLVGVIGIAVAVRVDVGTVAVGVRVGTVAVGVGVLIGVGVGKMVGGNIPTGVPYPGCRNCSLIISACACSLIYGASKFISGVINGWL